MIEMADLLIKNARYLFTMNQQKRIIKDGAVAIEGNRIIDYGKTNKIENQNKSDKVIDARKKIVMPGFINVHTHSGSAINRGVCEELSNVLSTIFLPLGGKQTKEDKAKIAMAALLDDIKFGCTTIEDDLFLAEHIIETGLRGVLNVRLADADTTSHSFAQRLEYNYDISKGKNLLEKGLKEIEKWSKHPRISCSLGPHGPDYCSKDLLLRVREEANENRLPITIHLAQTAVELHQVRTLSNQTPVEYLDEIGFLGPDVYAAHCMYTTMKDIKILKQKGVKICHSPYNMARLFGITAPLLEWLEMEIPVGICTDGAGTGDLLDAARVAMTLQRVRAGSIYPHYIISGGLPITPYKVLEMMTIDGARVLGLENEIGSIEVGKKADIILFDTLKPHLSPILDPIGSLIHYGYGSDVDTTIVEGKVIMEKRELVNIEETKILEEAQQAGERTYLNFQNDFKEHIDKYKIYKI
jgi:5-methylthioadenosine/S-adenosylhomocysteine deaminase